MFTIISVPTKEPTFIYYRSPSPSNCYPHIEQLHLTNKEKTDKQVKAKTESDGDIKIKTTNLFLAL